MGCVVRCQGKELQLVHAFLIPDGEDKACSAQSLQTALGPFQPTEQRAYAEASSEDQMSDS